MYICDICENVFDEPIKSGACSERLGYEIEWFCPFCGSNAVEETVQCDACENEFNEKNVRYLRVLNKYNQEINCNICDDCLYQALEEIVEV